MFFRGHPINRPTRIVAALVIMSIGAPMLFTGLWAFVVLGAVFTGIGVFSAGVESWRWFLDWKHRPDPYDLTRLWEEPLPEKAHALEPEEDDVEREYPLCHRCGDAVAPGYAVCPHCGCFLGT